MARSQPRYLNGEALKRERAKAGLKQKQLAALVGPKGVKQHQISMWETGYNGCELDTLHELAKALGVKPSRLMLPRVLGDDPEDSDDEESEAA